MIGNSNVLVIPRKSTKPGESGLLDEGSLADLWVKWVWLLCSTCTLKFPPFSS
jgi:hypothetical protein